MFEEIYMYVEPKASAIAASEDAVLACNQFKCDVNLVFADDIAVVVSYGDTRDTVFSKYLRLRKSKGI